MLQNEQIEKWAEGVLTVCLVSEYGEEQTVWQLLRHLFIAVKMHDECSEKDRARVASIIKLAKPMFFSKFSVKETRKNKKRREKFPPNPTSKEKEKEKERKEKTHTYAESEISDSLEERKERFRKECLEYAKKYDCHHVADFYNYWSETTKTTGKMRFEAQRFWNLEKRLARWMQNHISSDNTAAAIRLENTKAKQAAATTEADKQKRVAAERQQQDARREAEQERSKEGQMLTGEYLAKNPDSLLAKWAREREAREAKQKK